MITYNEIIRMFNSAGYEIEKLAYTGGQDGVSNEDIEFVNGLVNLSDNSNEFMYYVFQYIVLAKCIE